MVSKELYICNLNFTPKGDQPNLKMMSESSKRHSKFLSLIFILKPYKSKYFLSGSCLAYPQGDGKAFVCDNHDRAVICAFFRDLHLSLLCPGLLQIKISVCSKVDDDLVK